MNISQISVTHTYALLAVTPATYAEIAGKLRRADYHHSFDGDNINMHGIGLCIEGHPDHAEIIELKSDPVNFDQVWSGDKSFEVRMNDRPFAVGKVLRLRETVSSGEAMRELGMPVEYTGREAYALITQMHTPGTYNVDARLCIMSTRVLDLIDISKDTRTWLQPPPVNPMPD